MTIQSAATQPVAILGAGMMTGVGLTAEASCAAIRCGIGCAQETRFMGDGGAWLLGCEVPLAKPWRGTVKLAKLLAGPVLECLRAVPRVDPGSIALLLNVAERERPGRQEGMNGVLYKGLTAETGLHFHPGSQYLSGGRVGGALALRRARDLLHGSSGAPDYVVLAGVDSFLSGPTLAACLEARRLLTAENSNGFIPGEAGAAILLSRPEKGPQAPIICAGLGFATETATIDSEEPLRAEGLVQAVRAALSEARMDLAEFDLRLCDANGEQYPFKEAALALSRLLRKRKTAFDIWHPADCIGEVGAAMLPCLLGIAFFAARKGYAPGPNILCHLGNDDGQRAALVLRQKESKS